MRKHGFVKVAALKSEMRVGDISFNVDEIIKETKVSYELGVGIVVTPELSMTGYTCGDLFRHDCLLEKVNIELKRLVESLKNIDIVLIVGMPLMIKSSLYNVAVVINKGEILGIVPKINIPNNNEFYEKRWFKSGIDLNTYVNLFGKDILVSPYIIFSDINNSLNRFSIEVCEDLWVANCPSIEHSLAGANIIFNPSASPEVIGKKEYRRDLVKVTSAKEIGGYVYCSSGICESSSDLVFSGHLLICENGTILKEDMSYDFSSKLIISDIDVKRLSYDRINNSNYSELNNSKYVDISFTIKDSSSIDREYVQYPFVSSDLSKRSLICEEILQLQSSGLAKRLKHIGCNKTVIGISGGLDSTLAFLVIVEAYKKLGISNENIIAVTMPGFGTTDRTYDNACNLVKDYGATLVEVNIRDACLQHFKDIGIGEDLSITYENSQARERTQILMDIANKENGLVIGTGDLSELILGWCTYNGDHMSMYAVNSGVPKTLVRYIVEYVASINNNKVLLDILDTPISPELLPPDESGNIVQETESKIGPYVLHDFFLYHFLRYGASMEKILYLAKIVFVNSYTEKELKKWLRVFCNRFFSQQFKRNCLPDSIKIGSISVSPRGDLRMPSDMSNSAFINNIDWE